MTISVNSVTGSEDAFPGPGEMRDRCSRFDWSATPLGSVETWSDTLRVAANLVLGSGFPHVLLWGNELIQIYNDAFAELIQAKHPYSLGRGNLEVWPEVADLNKPIYERVFSGETVIFRDALYPLERSGVVEDVYLNITYSPVIDPSGKVAGVLAGMVETTKDVAFRKLEAERARLYEDLELERTRLATAFEKAPAFIATLRGPNHIFELANPPYYQLAGHREILGKSVAEALPEVVEQGFIGLLDSVYSTGEPFVGTEVKVLLQRRPGAGLDERYVNFVYQPLADTGGEIYGILVHGVDVTESVEARQRVEEQAIELEMQKEELQVQAAHLEDVQVELEASNEQLQHINDALADERARLSAVVDNAPVGIVIAAAPSGEILTGNRRVEEIFRHPVLASADVEAYGEWIAFHDDGRRVEAREYPLARVFTTGEAAGPDEYLYQRGDGTLAWVRITGSPIRGSEGELLAGLVVIDDIDAEKRTEQERERLIAELELERSRLRELFMQAPAMIAVLRGPDLVFELANGPYLKAVGGREVVGKPIREALPDIGGQGYFEMLDGVLSSGEVVVGDESFVLIDRRGDGELDDGYFNFVFQPLRDSAGTVDGILIHAVEVTEQVRARREVERLEERLRLALEATGVGTYDWDPSTGALSWDHRTRQMFGVPSEGEVTYDTFLAVLHPDDVEAANRAVEVALDPTGEGIFQTEYRVVWRGGETRWLRAVGRIYFEHRHSVSVASRFIGTVQDVTDQRLAEAERARLIRELEAGQARLTQIFAEAPAVMALYTGPEHIVTLVNPTWEKTVGKPHALGRSFRDVFPEFEGSGLFEALDAIYESGEAFTNPEVNVPLERWGVIEDTYWNLVWKPLAGEGPDGRDILVHAVEVTTQVRARQEVEANAEELARIAARLEVSNRDLDQFAYAASHDLKAPLRGIANLTAWIEEDIGEGVTPEAREHLDLLRSRVHRMEGLIDGILEYSRAGRVREKPDDVEVSTLLKDVVELLAPPEQVEIALTGSFPRLHTERLPLQQIFMNLIGNAIKYNRNPNPQIRVSAEATGAFYTFAVADNGPGIAERYHERIFGMFQTLEARDRVEGTGIGLSLVKRLVEARGGEVWVESEEGKGATFRFTWPKEIHGVE